MSILGRIFLSWYKHFQTRLHFLLKLMLSSWSVNSSAFFSQLHRVFILWNYMDPSKALEVAKFGKCINPGTGQKECLTCPCPYSAKSVNVIPVPSLKLRNSFEFCNNTRHSFVSKIQPTDRDKWVLFCFSWELLSHSFWWRWRFPLEEFLQSVWNLVILLLHIPFSLWLYLQNVFFQLFCFLPLFQSILCRSLFILIRLFFWFFRICLGVLFLWQNGRHLEFSNC